MFGANEAHLNLWVTERYSFTLVTTEIGLLKSRAYLAFVSFLNKIKFVSRGFGVLG